MEEMILDSICKCTEVMNNSVIEQTAYIRASADKKQLDLSKYKDEVRKEFSPAKNAGDSKLCLLYVGDSENVVQNF